MCVFMHLSVAKPRLLEHFLCKYVKAFSGGTRCWHCCAVKLWHTNVEHSVASLEVKANVCCVKFNLDSRFHLAFGSAGQ